MRWILARWEDFHVEAIPMDNFFLDGPYSAEEMIGDEKPSPLDDLLRQEAIYIIRTIINERLTPKQQAATSLFLSGMSFADIAREMNMSREASGKLVRRGLEMIVYWVKRTYHIRPPAKITFMGVDIEVK